MKTKVNAILLAITSSSAISVSGVNVFFDDFNLASAADDINPHQMERFTSTIIPRMNNVQVPGWTVVGAGADILVVPYDDQPENKAVWLNEPGDASITTTIPGLIAGEQYVLSWEHWGDNVSGPYDFEVSIGGQATTLLRVNTLAPGNFATESLLFIPTGSSVELRFADLGNDAPSAIIDNISVRAVPAENVPDAGGTLPLLAFAFAFVGAFSQRSRLLER